jgi:predicted 3-demethylubiquinone-9 3-methyltransferase (glyoxalase superfamily)
MQKLTPFLLFNDNAEDAIQFYTSVFKDSEIVKIVRYGNEGPGPKGSVMTASMKIHGQDFVLLNGGLQFKLNESISFVVNCYNQQEVDYY